MSPMHDNPSGRTDEGNGPVRPRKRTLEDHVLKFIEGNNLNIWIGILMVCALAVLLSDRG
ncbi:MAG: hypothetical protein EBT08_10280 [Betaproteobacteria bacterium]|nr:hypothetical protein [Betaproteobacteria bacterium]